MTHLRHRPLRSRGSLAVQSLACFLVCGALLPGPLAAERIKLVSAADLQAVLEWRPSPISPEIVERARATQLDLERVGVLDARRSAAAPRLSWPLRQSDRFDHPACWGAVSFVDHDPRFGFLLDYNGGQRTYDLRELRYNHQGSDFLAWPFGWAKVALAQVEVVAAAPGWIVERVDGNFDQECGGWLGEERNANLVAIVHEDGSMAFYGHLKSGSLTKKQRGEWVRRGEYLGAVGSSGYSSYPHLHFELLDIAGSVVDPFAGPANETTVGSWWREQPPYYDSRLYAIMSHRAEPTVACNNREWTEVERRFAPGDEVFLASYVRDILAGQRLKLWVTDPDGEVVASTKFKGRDPHWAIFLITHRLKLPEDANPGTWTVRARFAGESLQHTFEVGSFEAQRGVGAVRPERLRPGGRRVVRISGFGLAPDMAAYVASPIEVDHGVEVVRSRVKPGQVKLTLRITPGATPGPRHVVLTAPDYSQVVLENAFEVIAAQVE